MAQVILGSSQYRTPCKAAPPRCADAPLGKCDLLPEAPAASISRCKKRNATSWESLAGLESQGWG